MNDNPLISIILPVYNGENYISKSIESCLNQTYKNIELIIVNDCSNDNTLIIVDSYLMNDSRVKIINNLSNKKLPASLNIGHKVANGEYITWTSHDNFYKENTLEKLMKPLQEDNYDVSYSDLYLIDNESNIKKEILLQEPETLIFGNCIGASFLYKKEVYIRNKSYNENLFLVEDFDFWLRSIAHSKFFHVKELLYFYRTHPDSLSSDIKNETDKNILWKNNLLLMYENFFESYSIKSNIIATIFTNNLINKHTDINIIYSQIENINNFKNKLKKNKNFLNKDKTDKLFLIFFLNFYIKNKNKNFNFKYCLFILINFYNVITIRYLKIIIKQVL
jgi:glycosyltransferase involved in cell wall biosynthesis